MFNTRSVCLSVICFAAAQAFAQAPTAQPAPAAFAPALAPAVAPSAAIVSSAAARPASALAVAASGARANAPVALPVVMCDSCGTVLEVKSEKRKGSGGALGLIGGAVAGGMLGNQVGGGDGKKVATVAGAAGGALLGNELQKRLNRKTIHITTVKMKNGTQHVYESEQTPGWAVGDVVRLDGQTFVKP